MLNLTRESPIERSTDFTFDLAGCRFFGTLTHVKDPNLS